MNQFRIIYIWKCHNETPCTAILNKQKHHFSKTKNRKVKQVLPKDWYQWEGRGYKEKVLEGEYGGNIIYSCMKMEKLDVETALRRGRGE
jgi:hypothetical protein